MKRLHRTRRIIVLVIALLLIAIPVAQSEVPVQTIQPQNQTVETKTTLEKLASLAVKGRAAKTGYSRDQFGDGWSTTLGCDTRNAILQRDLRDTKLDDNCKVLSGILSDPYTGNTIQFIRGASTSDDVQIDHVVALSNAWQTGAQQLSYGQRLQLANDPLNLLAVDGPANQLKSDGDAATWLPSNKLFRCQYVSRQIDVKDAYRMWVTPSEKSAMSTVLATCR